MMAEAPETQALAELCTVRNFIDVVVRAVEDLRIYTRLNLLLDRVMLVLLLRCVRTARSVCDLAERGFGDEAYVLSRTALEICLSARHIGNRDSEKRAVR